MKYTLHNKTRGKLSPANTFKMLSRMRRHQAALLVQMRSGKVPLNSFLFNINSDECTSPNCSECDELENVEHFLFKCKRFTTQRRKLLHSLEKAKCPPSMSHVFAKEKAAKAIIKYAEETHRFHNFNQAILSKYNITPNEQNPTEST